MIWVSYTDVLNRCYRRAFATMSDARRHAAAVLVDCRAVYGDVRVVERGRSYTWGFGHTLTIDGGAL